MHHYVGAVDVDRQNVWANQYGLEHPVVSDDDLELSGTYWSDSARPRAIYIGPGAEVIDRFVTPEKFRESYADAL